MDILLMQENMRRASRKIEYDDDLTKLYMHTENTLKYLREHGDTLRFRLMVDPDGEYANASSQEIEAGLEDVLKRIADTFLNRARGIRNFFTELCRELKTSNDKLKYALDAINAIMSGEGIADEQVRELVGNPRLNGMYCTPPQIRDRRIVALNKIVNEGIALAKDINAGKFNQEARRKRIAAFMSQVQSDFGGAALKEDGSGDTPGLFKYLSICKTDPSAASKLGRTAAEFCNSVKKIVSQYERIPVAKYFEASAAAVAKIENSEADTAEKVRDLSVEIKFLKKLGEFIQHGYQYGANYDFCYVTSKLALIRGYKEDLASRIFSNMVDK